MRSVASGTDSWTLFRRNTEQDMRIHRRGAHLVQQELCVAEQIFCQITEHKAVYKFVRKQRQQHHGKLILRNAGVTEKILHPYLLVRKRNRVNRPVFQYRL